MAHHAYPGPVSALAPPGSLPASSLERAEVRDVLAWLRLLADPHDAAAVVRALARPPIELRQVELARVIQVARRRKLALVLGLAAAIESPQVPLEARERIQRFLDLHARVAADFASEAPDAFLARLIQRLRVGGRPLLSAREHAQPGSGLEALQELAREYLAAAPGASTRELAVHLAATATAAPHESPAEAPEPDRELHATLRLLRDELLEGIEHIGGRLSELRLDTELDVAHGVVRYLELLKLSALAQRPAGQSLEDALADIDARLLAAATPLQREILQTSTLDHTLLHGAGEEGQALGEPTALARAHARARALQQREQHSLTPFLPRKGNGLALSASDIHTYRSCPLRYKYARVLRIPVAQTVHQRFGIVVHQVLERYHADGGRTLPRMLSLLDGCWRRAGFGEEGLDGELHVKAVDALTRYHARLDSRESEPVWFERRFDFQIGPHHVRGRVDRVDRLPEGAGASYELIDYKTSRPKPPEELTQDIQLSLYALAAREDWQLECSRQAYYYVLDDAIVPVPAREPDVQAVEDIVLEAGDGIMAQEFHPTPAPATCALCDYRIACPAAIAE
jgi:CRISPR/Cas system-associated exonuclease Cas4 (RecB family)